MSAPDSPYPSAGRPHQPKATTMLSYRVPNELRARMLALAAAETVRLGRKVTVTGIVTAAIEAFMRERAS